MNTTNLFSCVTCDKSFSKFNELRKHKKEHKDKPFECTTCKEKFNNFATLVNHKKAHEKTQLPLLFSCPKCNQKFTNFGVLKKHEMIHTVEKPFKCSNCKNDFIDEENMRKHVHEELNTECNESHFCCTKCEKKLSTTIQEKVCRKKNETKMCTFFDL